MKLWSMSNTLLSLPMAKENANYAQIKVWLSSSKPITRLISAFDLEPK